MSLINVLLVCFISFIVSIFSISVGGTSLITVPVLISLGMISKNAVATNMFALIFLSMSGAIGFRKEVRMPYHKMISFFSILTICGSVAGANLILAIEKDLLEKVIAIMICIIVFSFFLKKDLGIQERNEKISKVKFGAGALLILILGIYGGFFSGGYVTLLSYVLILIFGLNFLQVAFISKIFNIFSSLVACVFFYYHDLIDFSVGLPLAFSMSLGAFLGTKLALAKGNIWIRNLFIIAVILLAIKLLIF
ncbi:MAG: TSUP family transporter [Candidatus Aminicenantes bacterium]|nr:TSUP family transporter [Candidatus Aminicenantes bacterium]